MISTNRAAYTKMPNVRIGRNPAKKVWKVPVKDRSDLAAIMDHVQKALNADTETKLKYEKSEIFRIIKKSLFIN